ncbi:MAG TPA: CDP-diacylglycerol--glycerol-3-phosphate 3-phosphatidyltransferase [Bacteroidetes bacterium]|nr:CDP-diacylglycerol--glycerol-3-phosphate 3-phosphatidyltransferase [Bacteroidota bacterium]
MTLPNQLSLLRIILTPVFVVTFCVDNLLLNYLSFFVFALASITDYYDGVLARKLGKVTLWGRFLDPLADKILISTAFIVFAMFKYIRMWMVVVIVSRDLIITGLRFYAMFKGKPIQTSHMAKAKTFSQVLVIYLIFFYALLQRTLMQEGRTSWLLQKLEAWNLINLAMLFVTLLTLLSGIKYLIENREHLKSMVIDFYHVFVPSDL